MQFRSNQNIVVILLIALTAVIVMPCVWKFISCSTSKVTTTTQNILGYEPFAEAEAANAEEAALEAPAFEDQAAGPIMDNETGVVMDGIGMQEAPMEPAATPAFEAVPVDTIPENYYFLDDGDNGRMSVQHNLCSPSCCSDQYSTPFKQKADPFVCSALKAGKLSPSNRFCSNSFQNSGCECTTREQSEFLYNRGGNGRNWF